MDALDTERLASIDETGRKKIIIPAPVTGFFRRRRDQTQIVLIIFFLVIPWVQIGGHQALLLDIIHREFSIFGLKLYAHDAPLVFLVLATLAFGLIFVTSVWGRAWCGWACPQTVFIDAIYRRLEGGIEGSYIERRRMQTEGLTGIQVLRRALKWISFFIVSSLIAHSFIAYFVGSENLLGMMGGDPRNNLTYFILISAMTAIILFDFGWFREQFCAIACPYGRFQSVLMDDTSLAIVYDEKRGEPRKGSEAAKSGAVGDCVSCRRCVEVCPVGIDIRRGVQMECIACTACADACDEIMVKVKKPTGLIRYSNVLGTAVTLAKPRAIGSGSLMLVAMIALTTALMMRKSVDVSILRAKGPVFQTVVEDGRGIYMNQFHLHIRNQTSNEMHVRLRIAGREDVHLVLPENPFTMKSTEDRQIPLFVKFSPEVIRNGEATLRILIETESQSFSQNIRLIGPVTP